MSLSQIQGPLSWIFSFHALCGALALSIFLVPLLSKKGGKLHVRTGWAYTVLMGLVAMTAFIITPWRVFFDSEGTLSSQSFAFFLFFISILTVVALWFGLIVLRFKELKAPSRAFIHIAPPLLLLTTALAVMVQGYRTQTPLPIIFPIIGILVSVKQLKYWLRARTEKRHWWYAHMNGMFTACIATITAFLVTAVPRFTDAAVFKSPILWIAPGAILGVFLKFWSDNYRKKFGEVGQQDLLQHR